MMNSALLLAVLLSPPQVIDGIAPIQIGDTNYAKAYVKQVQETPALSQKPDIFMGSYFSMKAKMMLPLLQTKYTAAHVGVCGTLLGIAEPKVGGALKTASDRITKGEKDFDSFTKEEQEAVNKALATEESPYYPFNLDRSAADNWTYFAGAHLGSLAAYSTVWHISPKQQILLGWIGDSVKAVVKQGKEAPAGVNTELAESLKAFAKFEGKTYDQATMKEIGKQIEATLKTSLPAKYRW